MVIVQLISTKTGEPIKGKRVSVSTSGFLSGGVTDRKGTNDKGEVEFSNIKHLIMEKFISMVILFMKVR